MYDSRDKVALDSSVFGPADLVGSLSGSKNCFDYPCPMVNKKFHSPHPESDKIKEVIDNWQDCGKYVITLIRKMTLF